MWVVTCEIRPDDQDARRDGTLSDDDTISITVLNLKEAYSRPLLLAERCQLCSPDFREVFSTAWLLALQTPVRCLQHSITRTCEERNQHGMLLWILIGRTHCMPSADGT